MGKIGERKKGRVGKEIKLVATLYTPAYQRKKLVVVSSVVIKFD